MGVSPKESFQTATTNSQPYRDRATHVLQTSQEAARWVARESLDLVFIDADHRFEAVRDDINAWWPTLRPGGVLVGHDFHLIFPGVVDAVFKFAVSAGLRLLLAPEVWLFVKPGGQLASSASAPEWLQGNSDPSAVRRCYLQ